MQFSGYWVSINGTSVTIDQAIFDETELTKIQLERSLAKK